MYMIEGSTERPHSDVLNPGDFSPQLMAATAAVRSEHTKIGFPGCTQPHLHSEPVTDADILPWDRRPPVRLKELSAFQTSRIEPKWLITAREIKQPLDVSVWAACNNPKLIKRQAKKGKNTEMKGLSFSVSASTLEQPHTVSKHNSHIKYWVMEEAFLLSFHWLFLPQGLFSFSDTKLNLD